MADNGNSFVAERESKSGSRSKSMTRLSLFMSVCIYMQKLGGEFEN